METTCLPTIGTTANERDLDTAMTTWHPDGLVHVVPLELAIEERDDVRDFFGAFLNAFDDVAGVDVGAWLMQTIVEESA